MRHGNPGSEQEREKGGGPPEESAKDMNDLRRQEQAEHGGTGGQDTFGQAGGEKLRDKQQRGGQADNTRQ
jgi:hypothetical protein